MKDLYERLNLSPDASGEMIRQRLRRIDDKELERVTKEILLRPDRRKVYDRNHRILRQIGDLRGRLDLNNSPNWELSNTQDFERQVPDSTARKAYSRRKAPNETSGSSSQRKENSTHEKRTEATQSSTKIRKEPTLLDKLLGTIFDAIDGDYGCLISVIARFTSFVTIMVLFYGSCASMGYMLELLERDGSSSKPAATTKSSDPETKNVAPPSAEKVIPKDKKSSSGVGESDTGTNNREKRPSFSGTAKPLPENGTWWDYTSDRQVAPLRISVSSREHYYIKVVDAYTEVRALTLFIHSGRTAQVEVPLGTYRLKYAVGETWYGREEEKPFGPDTRFYEAEDTFSFEIVGDQVRGHEVELILQQGGNLPTDPIPQSEF